MAKRSTTASKKTPKTILTLKNIHKHYQLGEITIKALAGIEVKINEGEIIAITGPSGSGKSTLLHVMGLLDKHSEGELEFLGKETTDYDEEGLAYLRNRYLGFVFQQFNLLPKTTTVENVLLPFYYSGLGDLKGARERATQLLTKVGLGERLKNYSNQLSGGQQQRVAIARALMNDPKIIFADEPTGNLDSKSGDEITQLLEDLHHEGKTVVIVTHDEDLAKVAHRRIKMLDGKIVSDKINKKSK